MFFSKIAVFQPNFGILLIQYLNAVKLEIILNSLFFFNLTKNKIQENRRTNKQDCFDLVNECNTDVGLACIGNNTQKQCL